MGRISIFMAAGVCALAGAVWFWQERSQVPGSGDASGIGSDGVFANAASGAAKARVDTLTVSPFSLDTSSPDLQITPFNSNPAAGGAQKDVTARLAQDGSDPLSSIPDFTTLGRSAISDADFLQLAAAFRHDPVLLQQLIDEFRQETDAKRRLALVRLLGEVGGDSVTRTASELIYSGEAESRLLGLELLQQVQPGNAAAREIASSLLATEVEPGILVGTLTSLAKPGQVDESSRQFLSEQVAFLTSHEDATVRSISLDILSRWSNDGQYTHVLVDGLSDAEPVVRESAVYALVGLEDVSRNVIDSLLSVAVDTSEDKRTRGGAILALKGMPISSDVRQQVAVAEQQVNTIQR